LEIIPLTTVASGEAAALFAERYRVTRATIPCLPARHEDANAVQPFLERMLAGGLGFGALDAGHLVGYLAGIQIPEFKGRERGFLAPAFGQAAVGDEPTRAATYRRLYAVAAGEWLRAGCYTHAITLPAPDAATRDLLFRAGFGMLVIDAVRSLPGDSPLAGPRPAGIEIRRAAAADAPLIVPLVQELAEHLRSSPIFLPHEDAGPAEQVEWLEKEDHALWLAFASGEPVGYIRCQPTPGDVAYLVQDPETVSITAAFVRPEYRSRGVAAYLLAELLDWATVRGYARCAVDCESANGEGSGFWLRHFTPVCYSLIRRVDERVEI
jgi:GNAT superfamily N-acetyltransferase